MPDADAPKDEKPVLPGNHGQFGENDATENYKPLENQPAPAQPDAQPNVQSGAGGPQQTNAGERS